MKSQRSVSVIFSIVAECSNIVGLMLRCSNYHFHFFEKNAFKGLTVIFSVMHKRIQTKLYQKVCFRTENTNMLKYHTFIDKYLFYSMFCVWR